MIEVEKLIPDEVIKYFNMQPNIGRCELALKAGMSNQKARFYCTLYKQLHKNSTNAIKKGM